MVSVPVSDARYPDPVSVDEPAGVSSPPYPIESVGRTLVLLQFLAGSEEVRLVDVRKHLGVAQSTAHRLMAMLVHHDFAVQVAGSRAYRAGPALLGLASSAQGAVGLRRASRPVLRWLAQESGETAHLGVLTGTDVTYLEVVESAAPLRVTGRVGRTAPAHTTSLGRSMLAALSEPEVARRYEDMPFAQYAEVTVHDLGQLLAELRRTRRRGWARVRNERASGIWAVAMAVPVPGSGVPAALSIATPAARSSARLQQEHASLLRAATERLRRDL